tara:strand:+ start:269 stop:703 length:435 start_codon:yes stop_codon:yes gene_type:complete
MKLKDLKVSQLATACGVITGKPVTVKSFNYKAKAIERVEALMKEHDLTVTDVLKAAGITMLDGSEPEAPKQAKAQRRKRATKQSMLIDMIKRDEGASISQIVEATGWQPHTVRGAISGALKKKLGLAVTSTKSETGGRVYRISA